MKPSRRILWAIAVVLAAVPALAQDSQPPGMALRSAGAVPAGRLSPLEFGLASQPSAQPDDLAWMVSSGVPWRYRYTYLSGGVDTGTGWETWNSPPGAYALNYMNASSSPPAAYVPVLTYYEICQSNGTAGPNPCLGHDAEADFRNLNNARTMAAYFDNFKLLLQQANTYGKPVVVHVEPDLWGFMQRRGSAASAIAAKVTASGQPDVQGYANTLQGFACALLHMRDVYSSRNVLMALHASMWSTGVDLSSDRRVDVDAVSRGAETAAFLGSACLSSNPYGGTTWDMVFNDVGDHDAGWWEQQGSPRWWDPRNLNFPNFDRYLRWVGELRARTGRPQVAWQVPIGNQYFMTLDNTCGHYQDNRAEYFIAHAASLYSAGLAAVMFGSGNACQTTNYDHDPRDGVTNGRGRPTVDLLGGCNACNNQVSTVADNDGGYLRMAVGRYYGVGLSG